MGHCAYEGMVWIANMGPKLFWGPGGLGPGLKAMSTPSGRRFGLSVNLSRNP